MRDAITHELAAVGELTAKGIASALDFEPADVIKELNDMLKNGLVERTKRYGNEYTYWLTQPVVAESNEIPVFAGAKPGSGASNPGSSGTDSFAGTTSSSGAAAISFTDSAAAMQELANALDEIDRLKRELQAERDSKLALDNFTSAELLVELQSYLEEGIAIQIGEDYINVIADGRAYAVEAGDCMSIVDKCVELERRLVA